MYSCSMENYFMFEQEINATMKAKFIAFASAVYEVVWLCKFLQHFGIDTSTQESMTIYCDNQAFITYTKDFKYHEKTKYIDIKYNYIKKNCVTRSHLKHIRCWPPYL